MKLALFEIYFSVCYSVKFEAETGSDCFRVPWEASKK